MKLYPFTSPSFLFGASRILDLGANFNKFNFKANTKDIDTLAGLSDWSIIGDDIKHTILNFDAESSLID